MKSKFFRVCICIALCLCLFTGVFAVMGWGSLLRQVGSAVMYPFSWLAGKTADAAAGFAGYFRDIRDLQAENDALRAENQSLRHPADAQPRQLLRRRRGNAGGV